MTLSKIRLKIAKILNIFLVAVREDRMPGGRNSGAVYNLYKVKYKKHKKSAQKGGQATQQQQQQQAQQVEIIFTIFLK